MGLPLEKDARDLKEIIRQAVGEKYHCMVNAFEKQIYPTPPMIYGEVGKTSWLSGRISWLPDFKRPKVAFVLKKEQGKGRDEHRYKLELWPLSKKYIKMAKDISSRVKQGMAGSNDFKAYFY